MGTTQTLATFLGVRDYHPSTSWHRCGSAELNLAGRQAIERGISMGRGSVWLSLNPEQYAKLKGELR
jgi:hypothetical protein